MNHKIELMVCFLYAACVCGTSARFASMIHKEVETIQKLAMIRQKILSSLGLNEDMPVNRASLHTPTTTQVPATIDRSMIYKKVDSFSSEISENTTDVHIVQFNLPTQSRENILKIEKVDLLIRVQYKRKTERRSRLFVDVVSKGKMADTRQDIHTMTQGFENRLATDSKVQSSKDIRRRRRDRRKKYRVIHLVISHVNSDGKPGEVISSVESYIRKSTTLKVALPNDKIQKILDSDQEMLKFHIQCKECGKKANIILVHKHKRKSKRFKSTSNNSTKYLHKWRPILLIQSKVLLH